MGKYRVNDVYDRENLCDATWEELYGTDVEGNLPQYRKIHIGLKACPCPYSTQAIKDFSDSKWDLYKEIYGEPDKYLRSKALLGSIPDPMVDHTRGDGKVMYMQPHYSGGWGYICMFDECPYYLNTGRRYFYK